MRPERWIHIFIVACGAILILIYNLHQPAVRKSFPVVTMVPLAEIESGREPAFLVPEPVFPSIRRAVLVTHSAPSRRRADPVEVAPAAGHKSVSSAAVAEDGASPAEEKMIPADRPETDQGHVAVHAGSEKTRPATAAERPAVQSSSGSMEKAGIPAGNKTLADDRIHREVVSLIRKYIAEQCSLTESGSRPVNLASAGKLPPVEGLTPRPAPVRPGRWVLGALAGPFTVKSPPAKLPASGMGADLYLGYKISGLLQVGMDFCYGQMRWEKSVAAAPEGLLQTGLQMRLFLTPRARISPMVLAGASYGQYYTIESGSAGEEEFIGKKSLPVLTLGAGVEYRISRSASAQLAVAYEKAQKPAFADNGRPGILELKAGLTLTLGGPRPVSKASSSGLAVIGTRPD
jgi:hypothetical protein